MIVPMQRLTLLCSAKAREAALAALRALGCVHVALEVRDGEDIRRASAAVAAAEQALRVLDIAERRGAFAFRPDAASPVAAMDYEALTVAARGRVAAQALGRDARRNGARPEPQRDCPRASACPDPRHGVIDPETRRVSEEGTLPFARLTAEQAAEAVNRAAEIVTRLREEAFALTLELRRMAPFGAVDPETLTALAGEGVPVTLFRTPEKTPLQGAFAFGTEGGFVYGAWVSDGPLPEGFESVPPPKLSTQAMENRLLEARMLAETLVELLAEEAETLRPVLLREVSARKSAQRAAEVAANLRAEGEVAWLRGYVPARAVESVAAKAQAEGWGIVLEAPEADDPNVPVLLEPPRGFRAIGTLFRGLGILPGYAEGDCSVPFYLFFSLFFAMLVGDAGYGAVMLAGVLTAGLRLWKRAAARPVLLILTVFCLATIVWGVLSGTYFGIPKESLPAALAGLPTVGWLGDDNNLMFLCFLIGAVHLSVARLWNAVLLAPSLKAVGELGWLGVTWSMFLIVCGIVVSWFASPAWTWWLLGGSVGLILVPLVADIRHEGVSIGMLPLNVISAMGDIISYVRLFAVGLASVKVAENFNAMALGLDLPLVARVLAVSAILLVGHGLNLAMGALSVLVHAVRLNTLEFSNAKGITWSGLPYLPFKQPQQ